MDLSTRRGARSAILRGGLALAAAAVAVLPVSPPAQASGKESAPVSLSAGSAPGAAVGIRPMQRGYFEFTPALYERRLNLWANRARERYGARPLAVRSCHDYFAERWTRHLVATETFYHQNLGPYMDDCRLSKAGEILASGPVRPYKMIQMWLNSPGHRALLLDPTYPTVGIAARKQDNGTWLGCIDFGRS